MSDPIYQNTATNPEIESGLAGPAEKISQLSLEHQDLLAVHSAGLSPKEMVAYFHIATSTIRRHMGIIFDNLGLNKNDIYTERQMSYSANLLTQAYDSTGDNYEFAGFKDMVEQYELTREHLEFMQNHNLGLRDLAILQLSAEISNEGIARLLNLAPSRINQIKSGLWKILGAESPQERKKLKKEAYELGKFSLSVIKPLD